METNIFSKQNGLTLIELLSVITVIGVLVGIGITVINPEKQRVRALDASIRQNLSDVVGAIETYRVAEGRYPVEGDANNPLDDTAANSGTLAGYISFWPTILVYNSDVTDDIFSLHVQKASDTNFFKYYSVWQEIRECGSSMNVSDYDEESDFESCP